VIEIPRSYNYISAFLTFACNFNCHYCINKYNGLYKYRHLNIEDRIHGLNRIKTRSDLPITITGGEPTLYKDFYALCRGIREDLPLDLLTNGKFDTAEFMRCVQPNRFKRNAKYASIRFSYHPSYTNILKLLKKVCRLQKDGYSVGIWGVGDTAHNKKTQFFCRLFGIDFRLKEYLDDKHGTYKYAGGLDGKRKKCLCKPSELLIAPDGRLFRCHYDLYHGVNSYGHLLDNKIKLPDTYLPCDNYGLCNPCDIKTKFNRFQIGGHCAVTIKETNG